jgi:transcriptional regulator with XRE-family HTH domain
MAGRERAADRARRIAREDRIRAGAEIRQARLALGRSQSVIASAARVSASQVGRIERGVLDGGDLDALARVAAVVGLDARLRLFPGADPALDAGQLRRLDRLRRLVPTDVTFRTEVPLPKPGDQRAWDAVLGGLLDVGGGTLLPVEVETRLVDVQAQTRRIQLKLRDSPFDAVLLVLADTKANRAMLRAHGTQLFGDFPVTPRTGLAALRAGRHPGGSSIVLL